MAKTALPSQKISYAYDISGSNTPMIKEFDIATGTVIEAGEVVVMTSGRVVSASTGGTSAILGVAAEPHDGATAPRQNGTKILVYCSPTAVFKCRPAQTVENTGVSATTFTDSACTTSTVDIFKGGYLKMLSIGTLTVTTEGGLVPVTEYDSAGTFTGVFTGSLATGDDALLLPPVGKIGFELNSDSTNLNLKTATNSVTTVQIVDVDTETEFVYFKFPLHTFGAKVS